MKCISKAIYLIDDNEHPFSGWTFDNRGLDMAAKGMNAKFNFEKIHPQYDTVLKRKFRKQSDGIVTLEANFAITAPNGFALKLYDENMNTALGLITKNGEFVLTDGTKTRICPGDANNPGEHKNSFKVTVDLDNRCYHVILNNTDIGEHYLSNNIENLNHISIGIEKDFTGKLYARGIKLYKDFACNERFLALFENITPIDWTSRCRNASAGTVRSTDNTFSKEDQYYFRFNVEEGGKAQLFKDVPKLSGDRCFEIKFIESEGVLDTMICLSDIDDSNGFGIFITGGKIYLSGSESCKEICEYRHNLWNTLRLEIAQNEVTVRLNGKDKGVFDAKVPACTTNIVINAGSTHGANTLGIDDILLFGLEPLPDDYVPVPKPAKTTGYHVGLHVCSLWRYGFWRGTHDATWDVCSAFDEVTPLLGYYDEGIPEVADWETKWFCENGIDFQLQCWYGPASITEPIKFPGFSHALHDGYFNSQYKSYSKFAIMWENNFTNTISVEAFKNYLVPYFIEYYFKDPGYYLIDNKPVFSIYSLGTLKSEAYFGSVETARDCMDFMREECKKAGFDGMILWCAGGGGTENGIKYREALGVEGSYAYNWGSNSFTSEYQEGCLSGAADAMIEYAKSCVHIPTVGVGFNAVSRHDKRSPSISIEEYEKILTWTRDVYLTNEKQFKDQNSWQSKTLLLSCWNEFDEGHYINPSGLHGFGFLDTLRKLFTVEEPQINTAPTENQKKRVNILYPEGHAWLRPERRLPPPAIDENVKIVKTWDFADEEVYNSWNLYCDAAGKEHRNGCLYGYETGGDPQVILDGFVGVPAKDVDIIHVEMRTTRKNGDVLPNGALVIYYSTSGSPGLSGGKAFVPKGTYNKETGFTDYYIATVGGNGWSGDIEILRLDPASHWEIKKIELMYAGISQDIYVDGDFVLNEIPVETVNGHQFITMYSKCQLMNKLHAAYRWTRATKEFTLLIDEYEFEFKCGSDIMKLSGEEIKLPAPVMLIDGVPAIPLKIVCDKVGYTYSYDEKTKRIDIKTNR